MSITTDFLNRPILDVDYGASNMAGFSGTYYHDWTIEKYLDYAKSVKGKDALKANSQKRHKQTTPVIHYKDARK